MKLSGDKMNIVLRKEFLMRFKRFRYFYKMKLHTFPTLTRFTNVETTLYIIQLNILFKILNVLQCDIYKIIYFIS